MIQYLRTFYRLCHIDVWVRVITPTCSSVRIDLNYDRNKHLCHCFTNGAMVHSFTGSACCLFTGRLAEASEEHDHKFIYLFLLLEISDESSPPPFKLASDATGNYIHKFAR